MEKETLKNILYFLEEEENKDKPFMWKLANNELTKEELNVKGDLDLEFSKITSLPEGLEIEGDLRLLESEINSLPEGLRVGRDLDLNWCINISSLPKGLIVGRNLYISPSPLTKYTDDELRDMIYPGFIKGKIFR
jgi:hypothetical protein